MAKLSEEKIQEILTQYPIIGTFSGTAKVVGCSPATVKRYVEAGIEKKKEISRKVERIPFKGFIIPPARLTVPEDWSNWFTISKEEVEGAQRVRKEA